MENQEIEYKESWRDEFLQTVCAFANTNGGRLYIGINDKGIEVGVVNIKKLLDDIPSKIKNKLGIIPSINSSVKNGKEILKITIVASNVPISYSGKYYIRSGSSTFELTNNELSAFLLKKSGQTWDGVAYPNSSIKNIKTETIEYFKRLAENRLPEISSNTNPQTTLGNLRLLEDNSVKNAGLLLFSDTPQQFFPTCTVRIGEFRTETELVTDDIIEGNLFEQVNKTLDLLKTKYLKPEYYYEGVLRKERYPYPEKALRESILNAIVHRDYSISSHIFIKVYPDKLIISNPGELPPQLTVELLKNEHTSIPKNPLLARVFYFAGLIESWGRGTLTMLNESRQAKAPSPVFENQRGIFSVTFYTLTGLFSNNNLSNRQQRLIKFFISNNELSSSQISVLLIEGTKEKISQKTIVRDLQELVEKKILYRKGQTKDSRYSLWEFMD
jgi:ATP-dependent DNA helicase RecG